MSKKLYYEHTYMKEWESDIISISQKENIFLVELEETAFYPEGGGQPSDLGTIDGIEVLKVYEEEGKIYHEMKEAPKNKRVTCRLDFERRFDHMVQHAGEHLVSGIFYKLYKAKNLGFHLGNDYVTIDINLEEVTSAMCREIEEIANGYIYENVEIKTYFVHSEKLDTVPLRKESKVEGEVRIVEIEGVDYIGCCGTHVARTGEIGLIKIIRAEKYKGMTRIYLKCGKRAFLDFQKKQDIVTELIKQYSVTEENIIEKVKSDSAQIKELQREMRKIKEQLFSIEAKKYTKNSTSPLIFIKEEEKSPEEMQLFIGQILLQGEYMILISSLKDKKVYLCHNGWSKIHCGKLYKEVIGSYEGKGGGSDKQAQGSFGELEKMEGFVKVIKEKLQEALEIIEI